MIIRSRPGPVKQRCEELVEQALKHMQYSNGLSVRGSVLPIVTLDQHERQLAMILSTLRLSGVLTHYQIGATRETAASTYEKTEWMIRIKFTDDPTKKVGYVADLLFHYYH